MAPRAEQPLTKLIDCAGIQRETGVKRAGAEAMMRLLPKVEIPGVKKTWVRREDVQRLIDEHTVDASGFRAHDGRGRRIRHG